MNDPMNDCLGSPADGAGALDAPLRTGVAWPVKHTAPGHPQACGLGVFPFY